MSKSNRLTTFSKKSNIAAASFNDLVAYSETTIKNLEFKNSRLETLLLAEGLNNKNIRDALCSNVSGENQDWCPENIGTIGSGPWEENEFDHFLRMHQVDPKLIPNEGINALIIGCYDFDEEKILEQIFNFEKNNFKIYTQELFVLGLILNDDPYKVLDQETIDSIAKLHSGIKLILENDMVWPIWSDTKTIVINDDGSIIDIDTDSFSLESPLKRMGYTAQDGALTEGQRRKILTDIFQSQKLDGIHTVDEVKKWGSPRSAQRLFAITKFINWLDSFQGLHKPKARDKWRSDIIWLKDNFYNNDMKFTMPIYKNYVGIKILQETVYTSKPKNSLNNDEVNLSAVLGSLIGGSRMSRNLVMNRLRSYIQTGQLEISTTGLITADNRLFELFGKKVFHRNELNSLISPHLNQI